MDLMVSQPNTIYIGSKVSVVVRIMLIALIVANWLGRTGRNVYVVNWIEWRSLSSQGSCVVVLVINYSTIGSILDRDLNDEEDMYISKIWFGGGSSPVSVHCNVGFFSDGEWMTIVVSLSFSRRIILLVEDYLVVLESVFRISIFAEVKKCPVIWIMNIWSTVPKRFPSCSHWVPPALSFSLKI